jgi:hypothetical protein
MSAASNSALDQDTKQLMSSASSIQNIVLECIVIVGVVFLSHLVQAHYR